MNEGTIASEGTTEELRTSGFDLAHLIQSPHSSSSTETNQPNAENPSDELVAREQTDVNTDDANEEAQNSYNSKGWHPYKFWAVHAGPHHVLISACFLLSWSAIGLGQSVSTLESLAICANEDV